MSKIILDGITKNYGCKPVLKDVSLELEMGHCYGILGRNGAGKSTLINIIMQRIKRDGGALLLDGKKLDNTDRLMRRLFCVSDNGAYPEEFKLKTIFRLTGMMYENFDMEYACELADVFNLELSKRVGALSTGYTTIFKVILALASNADFVFLDEPVLGLDVNMRELFYREFAKKMADSETCFVISTHLIEEAELLMDRIIIIHNHEVLLTKDTDELLSEYMMVSGKAADVECYIKGKKIMGMEAMGTFKRAVVCMGEDSTHGEMDKEKHIKDAKEHNLSIDTINLQEIFYYVTGGVTNGK